MIIAADRDDLRKFTGEGRAGEWDRTKGSAAKMEVLGRLDEAISDDLNTAKALTVLEETFSNKTIEPFDRWGIVKAFDDVLGLELLANRRSAFRIRPKSATITEAQIEAQLARRKEARAARDFATSDAVRDDLAAQGVEVMDGDPLKWEWKL